MAVLDRSRGAVVLRIVYDGPGEAGKTTTMGALGAELGRTLVTPEEHDGRTLYFDWLEYTAGGFDGHALCCQVVSVPGQAVFARRRAYLLDTADAIIYVAPVSHASLPDTLQALRALVRPRGGLPMGVVLQANKRDLPDALPAAVIRGELAAAELPVVLIETTANAGVGIRHAFVMAVRFALDRVREASARGMLLECTPEIENPEGLLLQMRAREKRGMGSPQVSTVFGSSGSTSIEPPSATPARHGAVKLDLLASAKEPAAKAPAGVMPRVPGTANEPVDVMPRVSGTASEPRRAPAGVMPRVPGTANEPVGVMPRVPGASEPRTAPAGVMPRVPGASEPRTGSERRAGRWARSARPPALPDLAIPSGSIWPAVIGRSQLSDALATVQSLHRQGLAWRAAADSGWILYSSDAARVRDREEARARLVEFARLHVEWSSVLSAPRCLLVADDGQGGARLWQVVRERLSLRDRLQSGRGIADAPRSARLLLDTVQRLLELTERLAAAGADPALAATLDTTGVFCRKTQYVGVIDWPEVRASPGDGQQAMRCELAAALATWPVPAGSLLGACQAIAAEGPQLVRAATILRDVLARSGTSR